MLSVRGGVEFVAREFWRSLQWETDLLLWTDSSRSHKKRLISLHLAPTTIVNVPSSPSIKWSEVEESIVRDGVADCQQTLRKSTSQ